MEDLDPGLDLDEKLTTPMAAAEAGIAPKTFTSYRSRPPATGAPPEPDGWYDKRTPWWYRRTIRSWKRPSAGFRSDLAAKRAAAAADQPDPTTDDR